MPSSLPIRLFSIAIILMVGCGTTQQRTGTEQLLLSEAVDRTVDQLDFSPLSGRKVFLDTTYIRPVKGIVFVNSDYIVSALRQRLTVSGCLIQDNKAQADYVLEARVGALGTDSLEVTYGLPASNALSQAAALVSGAPAMPTIPEISVGKRNATLSTSKIVMYAYHRETGTPVWQSGSAISKSDAKDTWVLGAGPLQRGSIYDGVTFAGINLKLPEMLKSKDPKPESSSDVKFATAHQFVHPAVLEQQLMLAQQNSEDKQEPASKVVPASHKKKKAGK
ncbi:MAG: DUF6655 family protein [Fuerstiella sp.]